MLTFQRQIRRSSFASLLLLPLLCASAQAAPASAQAPAATTSFAGELLGIVVPLVLIIVVLFAVLYVARRRFGLTGRDTPLSIVQILPVGPRERVVLVKSRAGRVFVIGVASHNVSLITHLEQADLIAADGTVSSSPGSQLR